MVLRPTLPANILRVRDGQKAMSALYWGLIPHWAKSKKIGYHSFNARAETITEKPTFRDAFAKKRGILVWDSYVEWREENGKKVPYEFRLKEPGPICFAGLWSSWQDGDDEVESCTLVTCEPNSLASEYHNRMPAILRSSDFDLWLDPSASKTDLLGLLIPFEASAMTVEPADPNDFRRKRTEASI